MKPLAAIVLALLALLVHGGTLAASDDDEATARLGRALYHGTTPFAHGDATTPLRLPVALLACAGCHGATGEGGREGQVSAPPLRRQALATARAGLPAYGSDEALLRAVREGRGRDGRPLDAGMPRFTLEAREARALLEHLGRLGTEADRPPGVEDRLLRLGTVLPLSGPAAPTGQAVLAGLHEALAEANARGGVHGRRIELLARDGAGGVAPALQSLRAAPVFALVGGLWNEAVATAEPALAEARLTHVASLVRRPEAPTAAGWSADLFAPQGAMQAAAARARGAVVLPMPAGLVAGGTTAAWQRLGRIAARLAVEAASRAGRVLDERALLAVLDRPLEVEESGPLAFGRTRRHAWDAEIVTTDPTDRPARGGP